MREGDVNCDLQPVFKLNLKDHSSMNDPFSFKRDTIGAMAKAMFGFSSDSQSNSRLFILSE